MKHASLAVSVATTVLLSATLSAEEKLALDKIVVTATRTPIAEQDALVPLIVIRRQDIERSLAVDVADLLQFHAGLDLGRNGGPGQATSLFIRGAESNHTLVLVDGVRINPGTIGGAALQNISPDMVERIEVVKGPRSALYGGDAIGGVVNIITRKPPDASVAVSAGGGRYGTRTGTLDVAWEGLRSDLQASVGIFRNRGFALSPSTDTDRGYDNTSATLSGSVDLGQVGAGFTLWRSSGNTEYNDFFGAPIDQDYTNQSGSIRFEFSPLAAWRSRLLVSRVQDEIRQQQSPDFVETNRDTLDWQNSFSLPGGHDVLAGVYFWREDSDSLSFGSGFNENISAVAVYLQDRYSSGRHDMVAAARLTDHDGFGAHTTWNLDYGFDLSLHRRLTFGAGTGFRAPDSTDRFGFGGNADLDAETSFNLDIGVLQRIGNRHEISLQAFSNEIDDLILFDFDPVTFVGRNRNIDRARIQGIEGGYRYESPAWRFDINAIVQRPENRISGEPLPRRAKRSVTATALYRTGPLELGLSVLASDKRKDSDFSQMYNAGYMLANLTGRYRINAQWSIVAKLENLLNARYETAAGFRTPGRGLYMRAMYRTP